MRKHELGARRIETVADLQDVLLANGHREKLQAISRLSCSVCGTCEAARRKPRSRNAQAEVDRRGFCQQCFMAEHMLEHEYKVDPESNLGEGGYGVVRRAVQARTGDACALKFITYNEEGDAQMVEQEAHVQMSLDHPNVCRLLEHFSSRVTGYLAFEMCDGGDLADLLNADGGVAPRDVSF